MSPRHLSLCLSLDRFHGTESLGSLAKSLFRLCFSAEGERSSTAVSTIRDTFPRQPWSRACLIEWRVWKRKSGHPSDLTRREQIDARNEKRIYLPFHCWPAVTPAWLCIRWNLYEWDTTCLPLFNEWTNPIRCVSLSVLHSNSKREGWGDGGRDTIWRQPGPQLSDLSSSAASRHLTLGSFSIAATTAVHAQTSFLPSRFLFYFVFFLHRFEIATISVVGPFVNIRLFSSIVIESEGKTKDDARRVDSKSYFVGSLHHDLKQTPICLSGASFCAAPTTR